MRPTVDELEEALVIEFPASDTLYMEDSRRLTGPGLLWDKAGAIVEVVATDVAPKELERAWALHARIVLDGVDWHDQYFCSRAHEDGMNLAISAPMDQLYSAIFVAQAAWHYAACEILQAASIPLQTMIADLKTVMQSEARPELLALQAAARKHGVDFVVDDDFASLGHGCGSKTWPVSELPDAGSINWSELHDVPVAMVTGTNGKSTCVRLASSVATAAGKTAGVTSTDFVKVGDVILDKGDYSGPGGARMLLRDTRLEVAFLEVARGGILRRGLALRRAQAALITNVAADHLGQYGINTVAALIEVKFSVFRTLAPGGVLVLNADDAGLVAHAQTLHAEMAAQQQSVAWFSLEKSNPCIARAIAQGQPCGWQQSDCLWYFDGSAAHECVCVADIPITMNGAAQYNVQNALGVMCLSLAFDMPLDAVRRGFRRFHSSPSDNPGRCNEFDIDGARVFVDFAHNPHSIAAVASTMKKLQATRRFLMLGHAGDRSDEDIRDLTEGAFDLEPDHVVITELPDYLRGRNNGEVSAVIGKACIRKGLGEEQMSFSANPLGGVEHILSLLQPGDLALLLVHSQRDEITELLSEKAKTTAR